jgi:hydrogenase small subunit
MDNLPVKLNVLETSQNPRISRRSFVRALSVIAAVLAIPESKLLAAYTKSLAKKNRLPVIWLGLQDCSGDTESFLRAGERSDPLQTGVVDPGIVDLLLDVISLEYHETLMAPSGAAAEKSRENIITKFPGKYLAIVEGAIPTAAGGAYCVIGGKTALSIAQRVCSNAAATLAVGTCASSGGMPCAAPNPTGAKSLLEAIPTLKNVAILPGCPMNVVNLVATIVYYVSFNALPPVDSLRRPTFAYGKTVHSHCPRRGAYEDGPHVRAWGDLAHRLGGCMVQMGCRGPVTHSNCPVIKWNMGTCWPVLAGHGCIGCTESKFWDSLFPYYSHVLED